MPRRQIPGLVGSVILFLGVFAPTVSAPIVGNINYFQNGGGDGVIILMPAIIAAFLTLAKIYRALLITSIATIMDTKARYIFRFFGRSWRWFGDGFHGCADDSCRQTGRHPATPSVAG